MIIQHILLKGTCVNADVKIWTFLSMKNFAMARWVSFELQMNYLHEMTVVNLLLILSELWLACKLCR